MCVLPLSCDFPMLSSSFIPILISVLGRLKTSKLVYGRHYFGVPQRRVLGPELLIR